jgi:GNAT superfamily N-acetyltransferase
MPTKFTLRSYTRADAPQVVAVVNAAVAQTMGVRRAVVDDAWNVRLSRYVPPASDKIVALDAQNQIVGYAYVVDKDQSIVAEVGGAVHPRYWGQGIGTKLLAWAEERAAVLARRAPPGVKTVLQANVFEAEQPAIQLFTGAGFQRVRKWVHLMVELEAPPSVPAVPAHLHLRPMDLEKDWELAGPAMDEAYADHWGTITLSSFDTQGAEEPAQPSNEPQDTSYSNSHGLCFLLLSGNMVVGGVFCNAKLVERGDTGRVGSVFVRPHYRRQGLGRVLMLTAFAAFWQRGIRRVVLDTDAESFTQAPMFYAHVGMRLYRREFLYEKEVVPGREVRRLGL